jgi:pyruvate dehydrogenase (quinone)
MSRNVSDVVVETLVGAGVKRVYGVVGDSLNGITDVIRKTKGMDWLHVRHEEVAAFAAGADAVCAGSCGPGNLHLINGLYDCHRNRVPVLAIAAQIPSGEIGSGYFQETHPEHLFKDCSYYCELISQTEQIPRVLGIAMRTAIAKRGVAVVIIPGDIALRKTSSAALSLGLESSASVTLPPAGTIGKAADILNNAKKVAILGGAGCQGSHAELIAVAETAESPDRARTARKAVHRVRQSL